MTEFTPDNPAYATWVAELDGLHGFTAKAQTEAADDEEHRHLEAAAEFAREVEREACRLRVREAGRAKVAAERSAAAALPTTARLDEFLSTPDEAVAYRVDRLWPVGGRVVLAAQHKAGKSTLVANLIRALVDAEPFLDTFGVHPVARVALADDELDERMLRRWLRDQGIRNTDRVTVVPLRGRLSSFNVLDAATRTRWAEHLGRAGVLIFDCLRPALDALGLDENHDAGRFLEALDEFATEAGIPELAVVHHMGHTGERSRGDSRILDWPDVLWRLVKDAEDEETGAGQVRRYLTAYGRDVDVPESLLAYDPATRRLSVAGGTRSDRKADVASADVIATVGGCREPLSGRAIESRLKDTEHPQKSVRSAVRRLVDAGQLVKEGRPGRGGGFLYSLSASGASGASEVRQRGSEKCVSASIDAQRTHYADNELDQVSQQRTSEPTSDTGADLFDSTDTAGPDLSSMEPPNMPADPYGDPAEDDGEGDTTEGDDEMRRAVARLSEQAGAVEVCPGCLLETAGPPGKRCDTPDFHAEGVLL